MEWTQEHIDSIKHLFPKQRGNVEIDYLRFFQALHYIATNGCTWRALPKEFGNWNSIYSRFLYWAVRVSLTALTRCSCSKPLTSKGLKHLHWTALMSKSIPTERVRPQKGQQSIGRSRGGLTTKIHAIVHTTHSSHSQVSQSSGEISTNTP